MLPAVSSRISPNSYLVPASAFLEIPCFLLSFLSFLTRIPAIVSGVFHFGIANCVSSKSPETRLSACWTVMLLGSRASLLCGLSARLTAIQSFCALRGYSNSMWAVL